MLGAYARQHLYGVLYWAFAYPDRQSDEDLLEGMVPTAVEAVAMSMIESDDWGLALLHFGQNPASSQRDELKAAFATIRQIATAVTSGEEVRLPPIHAEPVLFGQSEDYEGRPAVRFDGRFRDALVWTTVRLFKQVPRSLIRRCAFQKCQHIFVASGNQRHCADHEREAARLVQRRAEKAFRARQRKNKKKKRRKA